MHKQSFSFWQRLNVFFKHSKPGREREAALKVLHDETNAFVSHYQLFHLIHIALVFGVVEPVQV